MKKTTKNFMITSSVGLALLGVGTSYEVSSHLTTGTNQAIKTLSNANIVSDTTLVSNTIPTTPIVGKQVNQLFINRFNGAVVLENGQFVINQKLIPLNATSQEINSLNQLVSAQNANLKQILNTTPKSDVAQIENSVIVGQTPSVVQQQSQATQIITTSTFHEGSNYVHVYWWGLRIGISKSTLHQAGNAAGGVSLVVGGIGLIPGPNSFACGVVSLAIGALGFGASNAPGGIVFNCTPGVVSVWGAGWQ
ncbi:MAG: hypothetical protein LBI43_06450 [Streptococcaceae bacterium]|jgi:hypothetical protein|nr:hypothetical protein [Streptococcaceae bacterium]